MCGRFTLTTPGDVLAEAFGLDEPPAVTARYNIAPTQPILAIRPRGSPPGREAVLFRWGLVPREEVGRPLINARAETAARLPSFREAFRARRCLVAADGFYEWKPLGRRRQPYYIRLSDGRPFAFAALWEGVAPDASAGSCTLLTTEPNALLREVHDRMPVILGPADYARWLDPALTTLAALRSLLQPYPAEQLTAYPVDAWVNDAAHDDPSCTRPLRLLV